MENKTRFPSPWSTLQLADISGLRDATAHARDLDTWEREQSAYILLQQFLTHTFLRHETGNESLAWGVLAKPQLHITHLCEQPMGSQDQGCLKRKPKVCGDLPITQKMLLDHANKIQREQNQSHEWSKKQLELKHRCIWDDRRAVPRA